MGLFSWFARGGDGRNAPRGSRGAREQHPFAGAEIVVQRGSCCEAARAIAGKRFLAKEIPLVPLRDCDTQQCTCSYRRFHDRRTNVRRSADLGAGLSSGFAARRTERRSPTRVGRRASDFARA